MLQHWNNPWRMNVGFDRECFIRMGWIQFCLEIDMYVLVSVTFYQIDDLFESSDSSSWVHCDRNQTQIRQRVVSTYIPVVGTQPTAVTRNPKS